MDEPTCRKKRRSSGSGSGSRSGSRSSSGGDRIRRTRSRRQQQAAAEDGSEGFPEGLTEGSPEGTGRGLKRKIGCVEAAVQFGRKRNLDQYYSIGPELGQGKFGSVCVCYSKSTGERFACKAILKNTGEEGTAHMEVEIMQHLSGHPGVVTLKEVFEDAEKFYLVMELCSGGRLADSAVVKQRAQLCESDVVKVVRELMGIVNYCHEMGVVHRDIKPENILLTDTGRMKLADFGLATRVADGQKLTGFFGSPAYVAPEVLTGYYDEKADIWSAGVLLHLLLLGYLPFGGASRDAIFEAVKMMKLDFHGVAWHSVSPAARDLISRMLTHDVSVRLTANEVLGHPWFRIHSDRHTSVDSTSNTSNSTNPWTANYIPTPTCTPRFVPIGNIDGDISEEYHDGAQCINIDALTARISRIEISEPKRSRICGPVPVPAGLDLKTNLCTAF